MRSGKLLHRTTSPTRIRLASTGFTSRQSPSLTSGCMLEPRASKRRDLPRCRISALSPAKAAKVQEMLVRLVNYYCSCSTLNMVHKPGWIPHSAYLMWIPFPYRYLLSSPTNIQSFFRFVNCKCTGWDVGICNAYSAQRMTAQINARWSRSFHAAWSFAARDHITVPDLICIHQLHKQKIAIAYQWLHTGLACPDAQ
jgi:hypothetical protein